MLRVHLFDMSYKHVSDKGVTEKHPTPPMTRHTKTVISIRDAKLRARIEHLSAMSNGVVKYSTIIRAALEEKLTQLERDGIESMLHSRNSASPFNPPKT